MSEDTYAVANFFKDTIGRIRLFIRSKKRSKKSVNLENNNLLASKKLSTGDIDILEDLLTLYGIGAFAEALSNISQRKQRRARDKDNSVEESQWATRVKIFDLIRDKVWGNDINCKVEKVVKKHRFADVVLFLEKKSAGNSTSPEDLWDVVRDAFEYSRTLKS